MESPQKRATKKAARVKAPASKRKSAPKISLAPLTFEQALGGLLQVKPDAKPAKKRGGKKG